jgi:hypothetical protein
VTSLPTWAVWVLSFGSPTLTFVGVLISQVFSPEKRSRRQEVLNHLRWSAELAVSQDEARRQIGIVQLQGLLGSKLLDDTDKELVELALLTALQPVVEETFDKIEEAEQTDEQVQLALTTDLPEESELDVTSVEGTEGKEGGR